MFAISDNNDRLLSNAIDKQLMFSPKTIQNS